MQQPDGADVLAQGGAPSKAALMGMAAAKGKAAKAQLKEDIKILAIGLIFPIRLDNTNTVNTVNTH